MGLRKNPSFPYPKSISHITQKQQLKTSQTHYSFQNSIKNMHKGPEIEYPEKNWRYFTTGKFDYCVKTTKERTWTWIYKREREMKELENEEKQQLNKCGIAAN